MDRKVKFLNDVTEIIDASAGTIDITLLTFEMEIDFKRGYPHGLLIQRRSCTFHFIFLLNYKA